MEKGVHRGLMPRTKNPGATSERKGDWGEAIGASATALETKG